MTASLQGVRALPARDRRPGHSRLGEGPVTGQMILEVILPAGPLTSVPGYDLTFWPQARLGDVTIEALAVQPVEPPDLAADLLAALRAAGYTPLGPVRFRRPRVTALPT